MKEQLNVVVAGSYARLTFDAPTRAGFTHEYKVQVLIKVSNDEGPVVGLRAADIDVRFGEYAFFGPWLVRPFDDPARHPGLYVGNFSRAGGGAGLAGIDWLAIQGLLLCVRVTSGTQTGTGIASLPQIQTTHM